MEKKKSGRRCSNPFDLKIVRHGFKKTTKIENEWLCGGCRLKKKQGYVVEIVNPGEPQPGPNPICLTLVGMSVRST